MYMQHKESFGDIQKHSLSKGEYTVIINNDALKTALEDSELTMEFFLWCKNCKAVLYCRVFPVQKAPVVSIVKNGLDVAAIIN